MSQVIISLKPEYGKLVLSGSKTVELRNRIVRIEPGTKIWIYITRPIGEVVAMADLSSVIHDSPVSIWRRFCRQMCIDWVGFADYVGDRPQVSALLLGGVTALDEPIPIGGIRRVVRCFHPPQFYSRVVPGSGLFRALNDRSDAVAASMERA